MALPWPWLVFAFLQRPEPDPECAAAPERDEGSFLSSKEKAMQPGLELCRSGAESGQRGLGATHQASPRCPWLLSVEERGFWCLVVVL